MRLRPPRFRVGTLLLATAVIALLLGWPSANLARQRRQSAALHAAQARFWCQIAHRRAVRGATDGEEIARGPERPRQVARAAAAAEDYRKAAAYHQAQQRAFENGW